jgi:4-amino-4-deoxychorismate lyase
VASRACACAAATWCSRSSRGSAGAKTLNRLENVLARSEWDDPAIAEGLIADADGRVIEGTMSNVFIAVAGRVFTPDLARCGVVGAQRERVRELLRRERVHCEERDLRWTDVLAAEEIFLTNSLIGVWPVRQVDERRTRRDRSPRACAS